MLVIIQIINSINFNEPFLRFYEEFCIIKFYPEYGFVLLDSNKEESQSILGSTGYQLFLSKIVFESIN